MSATQFSVLRARLPPTSGAAGLQADGGRAKSFPSSATYRPSSALPWLLLSLSTDPRARQAWKIPEPTCRDSISMLSQTGRSAGSYLWMGSFQGSAQASRPIDSWLKHRQASEMPKASNILESAGSGSCCVPTTDCWPSVPWEWQKTIWRFCREE